MGASKHGKPLGISSITYEIFWIDIDESKIISFYGAVSKNDSITLTCIADGLPTPVYTIISDNREIKEAQNGIAIIANYSLNDNVTYKCICTNSFGHDTKYFSPSSFKGKCNLFKTIFY